MNTVQIGGTQVNPAVTSKEQILSVCRSIIAEKGVSALSMRAVAERCHVALGSLYNYFPSKDDLLTAAVESVWEDIFREAQPEPDMGFAAYILWLFQTLKGGAGPYGSFLTAHALSLSGGAKDRARGMMAQQIGRLRRELLEVLARDPLVRRGAFGEGFRADEFVDFVLSSLLAQLMREGDSCAVLAEMIRRTIYDR